MAEAQAPRTLSRVRVTGFHPDEVSLRADSDLESNPDLKYHVVGAVVHQGASADQGHYWAVTRGPSQWQKKDDERMSVEKDFLPHLNAGPSASAAYVILKRKD